MKKLLSGALVLLMMLNLPMISNSLYMKCYSLEVEVNYNDYNGKKEVKRLSEEERKKYREIASKLRKFNVPVKKSSLSEKMLGYLWKTIKTLVLVSAGVMGAEVLRNKYTSVDNLLKKGSTKLFKMNELFFKKYNEAEKWFLSKFNILPSEEITETTETTETTEATEATEATETIETTETTETIETIETTEATS